MLAEHGSEQEPAGPETAPEIARDLPARRGDYMILLAFIAASSLLIGLGIWKLLDIVSLFLR